MKKFRELEINAFEEIKNYLDSHPKLEPLQNYIQERLGEAGNDPRERMKVMMELIRFQIYLETLPEYQALKAYVEEVKVEAQDSFSWKKSA